MGVLSFACSVLHARHSTSCEELQQQMQENVRQAARRAHCNTLKFWKDLKIGKYDFYGFLWAYKLRKVIIFINLKSNIRVET
jgi:hypothetical protein